MIKNNVLRKKTPIRIANNVCLFPLDTSKEILLSVCEGLIWFYLCKPIKGLNNK